MDPPGGNAAPGKSNHPRQGLPFHQFERSMPSAPMAKISIWSVLRLSAAIQGGTAEQSASDRLAGLTPREREVLQGIAEGRTNKEIAAALGLRSRTVESYRESLMRKLGIYTVAELTRLALEAERQNP